MPVTPLGEQPKKSNQGLIIGIVVVVVLCCCCSLVGAAYTFGDQIMAAIGG